jgi:hypothetical protein
MMAVHSKSVSSYLMIRGPPFGSFAVTSGRRFSDASQQGGKFVQARQSCSPQEWRSDHGRGLGGFALIHGAKSLLRLDRGW